MLIKVFILVFSGMICITSLRAQCPQNDSLWNSIHFLSNASDISPASKLKELLEWEKRIKQCDTNTDTTHALLFHKIGILYFKLYNYFRAIQYIQQSIAISSTIGKTDLQQEKLLIKKYYDLSKVYDSLRNDSKRLTALDSIAAIGFRINEADEYYLSALYARAEYYFDVGDYNRCISYATFCEKIAQEYTDRNPDDKYDRGIWYAFSSLGWSINAMLQMERYEEAEKMLYHKLNECKKKGLKKYYGILYVQLADIQSHKKQNRNALLLYQQALRFELKWGSSYNCRVVYNNIGYLYSKHLKDITKGLFYYKKAIRYYNNHALPDRMDTLEMLNVVSNIGSIYARQNQFDSAFAYYQTGFNCIKPGLTETGLLHMSFDEFAQQKKLGYLTALLLNKGEAYLRLYKVSGKRNNLDTAVRIYNISDKVFDRIRNEQRDAGSKLFWRADSRRLYENAIDACYLLGNTKDAFYFFEKSRAALLNDQLSQQRWMGETDIMKQTQLKKQILRLEKEWNSADTAGQKIVTTEIFSKKQELDFLEQQIKTTNPLYYQSFLDTGFITVKEVQQTLLKKHHALLEIFSGDSVVYALLVTANNSYLTKINKQDYENTTLKFIAYLSDAGLMNRRFNDFTLTAADLYQLIFRNLPVPGNRIIISPDGQYFPFEALVTNHTGQPPAWFLNTHAVSYTYSARFLMNDFSSPPTTTGKNFMGIAPVSYPAAFSLATLPGSDRSLHTISAYFDDAVTYTATDASRSNFTEQFSKYRVIQLYTHAADSSENKEPVIYFADSALYLSDLVNVHKPFTRLIVLSACQTANGKNYHGEGVFSFNRGFAALGVPAAIANLWSVDNTSTYLLTELFYKHLANGLPTDIALQKAKLEFLETASKEKSMPCYWAASVLIGKTDTLAPNKTYTLKWIIIFGGLLCIVMGAITIWFIRKHKADAPV